MNNYELAIQPARLYYYFICTLKPSFNSNVDNAIIYSKKIRIKKVELKINK